ncbi:MULTISPECIES: hypothetical protein [Asaia]|uniref:hypothetical protein n=1 Tax=Asaia TaxID=91914 RepID=UPI002FC347CC
MDRKIIYPGQIPLVEDQLQDARFAQIAVGRLAGALYGEGGTGASGFACAPGGEMTVTVSPGEIIQAGVIDASAFGVLSASASALPRQYILTDPVNITIPGAGATYIIYGTLSTADTANAVLPYFNSANPSQTFAGSGNGGANQPTVRSDYVTIGVASSLPSGSIPLWAVAVPSGATSITAAMISAASGAPLYPSLRSLAARIVAPFNANLAAAFGGYPSKAIVADPNTTGAYWVSTADNNLTTPGASGATWQSLFAGYLTSAQSDLRYVQGLRDANTDIRVVYVTRNSDDKNIYIQSADGTTTPVQPLGDFATNTSLNNESLRAQQAETANATAAAQASSAATSANNNANGRVAKTGDAMTGPLSSSIAPNLTANAWNYSPAYRSYTNSRAGFRIFSQDQVNVSGTAGGVFVYDWNGADQQYWWFLSDGSINQSSKGQVAWQSQLPLPVGMKCQPFYVTIPQGTSAGINDSPYIATLPQAFSSFSYATGGDNGTTVFTVSASPQDNARVKIWVSSGAHQSGALSGPVVVTILAFGYY